MRLLLVEDESKIARALKRGLEEERYAVDVVDTGGDALALADVTPYDLVILDLMLPDMHGMDVTRHLRRHKHAVPVLMLTARGALEDRVAGLDSGADDYLTKPFAFAELLARVRALLRRQDAVKSAQLQVGDMTLDTATHGVVRAEREIELSSKEYAVLEYLMRHAGQVVRRNQLLEAVWDYDFHPGSNVVDVYIGFLRRKIDDPFAMKLLETRRGIGYRLRIPDGS